MNVSNGGSGSTDRNEENERLGALSNCELVLKANIVDRRKAVKVVSGKIILATRCDSVIARNRMNSNDSFDPGKAGKIFYDELEKKINNWKKPDTSRIKKSFRSPDMDTKKKRGGKKVRAQKENFAVTESHKMMNKHSFLSINSENGDNAMGFDTRMLGGEVGGSGKLRALEANKKNTLSQSKAAKKGRGVNG